MLNEDKYILIERFFNSELNATEQSTFERLLSEDIEFREEVKIQRSLIGGIQLHVKDLLRQELTAIYAEAKPDIEKQKYKPKARRNLWKRILKWATIAAVVGGAAALYVRYKDELL